MGEFVAIYARPTGKNTNDGVEKKLLHNCIEIPAPTNTIVINYYQ